MKLIYSPSYNGFIYTDKNELMFNQKIVDTTGLVEEIKLHAGLCGKRKDDIERLVNYYKAMKTYMEKNPNNVLKESFDVDGLNVAKECLSWRDTLSFAGWNKSSEKPSKRLEALSEIEEYFCDKSLGEELVSVIKAVKDGCILPNNLEIETLTDWKLFSPLEVELIEALSDRDVKVNIKAIPIKEKNTLAEITEILSTSVNKAVSVNKDETFNILHFEEQDKALRYLSLLDSEKYDLWINSDNKALDNWLNLQGKALSGSRIQGGLPQINQLLSIGLGIFVSPMNLKNLIEWLNIPLSPLKKSFRNKLESQIAREGGYYNEKCRNIIKNFMLCNNEYTDLEEIERKAKIEKETKIREKIIADFLPNVDVIETEMDGTVNVKTVLNFINALYDWTEKEIVLLNDESQKTQLSMVRNECSAVITLLESEDKERINYVQLMGCVSNLKSGVDMIQYEAEEGCRTVVSNPGQIASNPKKTIWCDFYNEPNESLKYDFLLPDEKECFRKTLKLWDEEKEREYNQKIKMLPFTLSENLTLVVIDRKITEDVEKHPIFIQLEKTIANLSDFIQNPDVNKEYEDLLENAQIINNGMEDTVGGLSIKNANLIKWPEREHYSSLDQLIYNPFDYAFSKLAGIQEFGISSLPTIQQARGTVAHGVIETLFNKYENIEGSGTVPFIKENIKNNFDKVFNEILNGNGAIFLSKENVLSIPNYKQKVFDCVNKLVKVMEENKLHVISCEPYLLSNEMNFENGIEIGGYADMILADDDDNPIVFDFKWYPGKEETFKESIKENKAIQLELYKYLTLSLSEKKAKAVAYVILPDVSVISSSDFVGENCIKVLPQDADEELLQKIKNSYKYRRNQISNGFIEEATGFSPENISYQNDVEDENLLSLNFTGVRAPKKEAYKYSKVEIFKTRK